MKVVKYLIPYVLISSFNYYFAKEAISSASPIVFNLIRYLISTAIFVSLTKKVIFSKDIIQLAIYTTASSLLWAYGLLYVTPAESAVLSYTMPLFSIPIALLVLSENPTLIEIIGVIIGFSGVILYGLPLIHGFTLLGSIVTVINAIFWASFSVYYRKLREYNPLVVNSSQFAIGSIILTLLLPIDYKVNLNEQFVYGIAYTSIPGGALSFFLWNMMVKIEKISRVTVLSFLVPIITTLVEYILYGTLPLFIQIIGIILMFVGILVSRIRKI
ncbi:DMT family transporter [Sulfurisphaera ohwakuensis]|uniref:DMT family transporter n=1 Tax=Sulfurisphaera ohwakuensis TaxID=69656 RepID=UPI0036F4261D